MGWTCAACGTANEATVACVVCGAAMGAGPQVPEVTRVHAPVAPTPAAASPNHVPHLPHSGPTPSGAPAAMGPPAPPRRDRTLVFVAIAVVVVGAVAGGAFALLAGGSRGTEAASTSGYEQDEYVGDGATGDGLGSSGTEDDDPSAWDETTTSTTTTMPPRPRQATLESKRAKIRAEPRINAAELAVWTDEGMVMDVLEEATPGSGWYRVRARGIEGYLFGSFVDPPAPGLCIGFGRDDRPPALHDDIGNPLFTSEPTGAKVLITGELSGDRYPVRLPTGGEAWVHDDQLVERRCG
jgi:hypothetical protein